MPTNLFTKMLKLYDDLGIKVNQQNEQKTDTPCFSAVLTPSEKPSFQS